MKITLKFKLSEHVSHRVKKCYQKIFEKLVKNYLAKHQIKNFIWRAKKVGRLFRIVFKHCGLAFHLNARVSSVFEKCPAD